MSTSPARRERREAERGAADRSDAGTASTTAALLSPAAVEQVEAIVTKQIQMALYNEFDDIMSGITYGIEGLDIGSGTMLDIGANRGAATVWGLYQWPACRIHAYEPCAATFEKLNEAVGEAPRVTLHKLAVTDAKNPTLHYGVNCDTENSIHRREWTRDEGERVKTISPTDLPKADFLKIDAEGCELEIVRAYVPLHKPRGIALEWHSLEDRIQITKFLRARGYVVSEHPNVAVSLNKNVYIGIIKAHLP